MGKTIYDPEMRYSEQGKRLYEFWKRIRRKVCSPVFDEFEVFYNWAMANGYTDGARLHRFNKNGPYSPANCYWLPVGGVEGVKEPPQKSEQSSMYYLDPTWMWKWDETVNRIRRHYGMEPIHSQGGTT